MQNHVEQGDNWWITFNSGLFIQEYTDSVDAQAGIRPLNKQQVEETRLGIFIFIEKAREIIKKRG